MSSNRNKKSSSRPITSATRPGNRLRISNTIPIASPSRSRSPSPVAPVGEEEDAEAEEEAEETDAEAESESSSMAASKQKQRKNLRNSRPVSKKRTRTQAEFEEISPPSSSASYPASASEDLQRRMVNSFDALSQQLSGQGWSSLKKHKAQDALRKCIYEDLHPSSLEVVRVVEEATEAEVSDRQRTWAMETVRRWRGDYYAEIRKALALTLELPVQGQAERRKDAYEAKFPTEEGKVKLCKKLTGHASGKVMKQSGRKHLLPETTRVIDAWLNNQRVEEVSVVGEFVEDD